MPADEYRNEGTPSLSDWPYARGESIHKGKPPAAVTKETDIFTVTPRFDPTGSMPHPNSM